MAVATVIVIFCRQFSPILQSRQSSPKRVHSVLFILLLLVLTSAFTSSCDPHILTVTRPAPLLTHVLTPFGQKMSEKMSGKTTVTVYDGFVYHPPPLGRFSKVDCSTTDRVPIPNDTSSESSRRDVPNADLFGANAIFRPRNSRPRDGCDLHRRVYSVQHSNRSRQAVGS